MKLPQMQATLFNPYATLFPIFERLPLLVEHGYLQHQDAGYSVTDDGRTFVNQIELAARDYIGSLIVSPPLPLAALATTLVELVHRSWQAAEPLIKAHQARTQRRLSIAGAPPLVQIEWAIVGLWEARDDAHIAAWRAYGFSGPVLDILSHIWRQEAQTLPTLTITLAASQSPADIEQALQELTALAYIRFVDDHFELTPHGQQIRDTIEHETDRLFFAPWNGLPPDEIIWLAHQLEELCAFFEGL